jgi:hypothetical protein
MSVVKTARMRIVRFPLSDDDYDRPVLDHPAVLLCFCCVVVGASAGAGAAFAAGATGLGIAAVVLLICCCCCCCSCRAIKIHERRGQAADAPKQPSLAPVGESTVPEVVVVSSSQ